MSTLAAASTIVSHVCPPAELSEEARVEAFELLCRHFEGVTRE